MSYKSELELLQIIVEAVNCIKKQKQSELKINLEYLDRHILMNDSAGKAVLKRTELTKAII